MEPVTEPGRDVGMCDRERVWGCRAEMQRKKVAMKLAGRSTLPSAAESQRCYIRDCTRGGLNSRRLEASRGSTSFHSLSMESRRNGRRWQAAERPSAPAFARRRHADAEDGRPAVMYGSRPQ